LNLLRVKAFIYLAVAKPQRKSFGRTAFDIVKLYNDGVEAEPEIALILWLC
jgi:hypothetical protein